MHRKLCQGLLCLLALPFIFACQSVPKAPTVGSPQALTWSQWSKAGDRAPASIIGLYSYSAGDKISVSLKDGKPQLRIEVRAFPDVAACTGFQLYRREPLGGELMLVDGDQGLKGTGFGLWESEACLQALMSGAHRAPRKPFAQDIDLNREFFGHFSNGTAMAQSFEKGDFVLGTGFQRNAGGYDSSRAEVTFDFNDIRNGKVLVFQEYIPVKVIDLGLTTPKEVKGQVELWEAGYGPWFSPSEGIVKQKPSLTVRIAARELNSSEAEHWSEFYRFYFHKQRVVSKDETLRLAKQGEVFCSLQAKAPSSFKGKILKLKAASDLVDAGSKGMTFSQEEDEDADLRAQAYYTHFFSLRSIAYGNKDVKTPMFIAGSCSTPKGNYIDGRKVQIADIHEHIPGVTFFSDYPEHQR